MQENRANILKYLDGLGSQLLITGVELPSIVNCLSDDAKAHVSRGTWYNNRLSPIDF